MEKNTLKTIANVLTLISAIIHSVAIATMLIFVLVSTLLLDDIIITTAFFLCFIVIYSGIVALLWIARTKASKGEKSWAIYGICHTGITGDLIGLAGHICTVIYLSNSRDNAYERNLENEVRIARLKKELKDLEK